MALTLLLRSPAFCSALSADFAVLGPLLPVHWRLHAHTHAPYIVFSRAAPLCCFAAFRGDETIYKLKLARFPHVLTSSPWLNNQLSHAVVSFSDVVATSVVAIDCPRVRFPAERLFFLLFFGLGRPVRQTDQFSRPLDAMPKTTNERRATKNPSKKIHSPIYFTLYGPILGRP